MHNSQKTILLLGLILITAISTTATAASAPISSADLEKYYKNQVVGASGGDVQPLAEMTQPVLQPETQPQVQAQTLPVQALPREPQSQLQSAMSQQPQAPLNNIVQQPTQNNPQEQAMQTYPQPSTVQPPASQQIANTHQGQPIPQTPEAIQMPSNASFNPNPQQAYTQMPSNESSSSNPQQLNAQMTNQNSQVTPIDSTTPQNTWKAAIKNDLAQASHGVNEFGKDIVKDVAHGSAFILRENLLNEARSSLGLPHRHGGYYGVHDDPYYSGNHYGYTHPISHRAFKRHQRRLHNELYGGYHHGYNVPSYHGYNAPSYNFSYHHPVDQLYSHHSIDHTYHHENDHPPPHHHHHSMSESSSLFSGPSHTTNSIPIEQVPFMPSYPTLAIPTTGSSNVNQRSAPPSPIQANETPIKAATDEESSYSSIFNVPKPSEIQKHGHHCFCESSEPALDQKIIDSSLHHTIEPSQAPDSHIATTTPHPSHPATLKGQLVNRDGEFTFPQLFLENYGVQPPPTNSIHDYGYTL